MITFDVEIDNNDNLGTLKIHCTQAISGGNPIKEVKS